MVLDGSTQTLRGSLFVVILLLVSDRDGFGCPALFSSALSTSIATLPSTCSFLIAGATSLVSVSCAVLVVMLGRVPDADDPPYERQNGVVSDPAVCPARDRRHCSTSVYLSLLDP